nr:MAG TPA: hypothetical protein [Caudoviricetes sp.]
MAEQKIYSAFDTCVCTENDDVRTGSLGKV